MPEHNMEDIFREKLNDFAPSHGDRWEQIANALPPEKKRRIPLWIWFSGAAIIVAVSGIAYLQSDSTMRLEEELVSTPSTSSENVSENVKNTPPILSKETPAENPQSIEKYDNIKVEPIEGKNRNAPGSNPSLWTGNDISIKGFDRNKTYYLGNGLKPIQGNESIPPTKPFDNGNDILDITKTQELVVNPSSADSGKSLLAENPNKTINPDPDSIKQAETPEPPQLAAGTNPEPNPRHPEREFSPSGRAQAHPWSFGIGAGAYHSSFVQKMPKNPGNTYIEQQGMVARNRDLREDMERAGSAFSQTLWVEYKPFKHWSFSTGISMVQTTQNLSFNVQNVFDDSIRGPQHFPEGGSITAGGQYIFVNDSILPGNSVSALSKYYAREIPLYINFHHKFGQKWSLQASLGLSYRWVRSASIYMADIDNVGILRLDGPENYPGIRNTFQIQGGIGLNYHFNEFFSLQAMPSFSYSVQSNIRFSQYVQQYQRQWGMQLKLTRNLDF